MLSELTIVVPTYNRQRFVERQIDYWGDKGVCLEILDGSTNSLFKSNRYECGRIRYWHLPSTIEERLGFIANHIETKYAALLSDDEFFLPSGCDNCLKFLEQNQSYSAVKGLAIGFNHRDGAVLGCDVYPGLSDYHVQSESSIKRMLDHMSNYEMATLWSIQRADAFRASLRAVGAGGTFRSAAVPELIVSLVTAYLGKIKVLNELMWLRSFENENIWWEEGRLSAASWWTGEEFIQEHRSFLSAVCLGISTVSDDIPAATSISEALNAYCASHTDRRSKLSLRFIASRVLPAATKAKLKHLLRVSETNPWRDLLVATAQLERRGTRVDISEVRDICQSIDSFYRGRCHVERALV